MSNEIQTRSVVGVLMNHVRLRDEALREADKRTGAERDFLRRQADELLEARFTEFVGDLPRIMRALKV